MEGIFFYLKIIPYHIEWDGLMQNDTEIYTVETISVEL